MSAFEVYANKLGLLDEKEDNEAMRQGRDLEEYVAQRFAEETGKKIQRRNAIFQHPEYPYLLGNIDRKIVGENSGLEVKTTSILNKADFKNGEYPPNYYVQCCHYMACCGFEKMYLAVLVLNRGFHMFEINRDDKEIDALIEAERYFWEEHVQKRIPPAPDGSEKAGEVLKQLFPEAKEKSTIDLLGMENTITKLTELTVQAKDLDKQIEALKQLIQSEMGENELGLVNGYQVKWANQSRSGVDSKLLKAEYPDIYENVLRQTSFRKFEVKKLKG
jgi:putative phage-type endonuclease